MIDNLNIVQSKIDKTEKKSDQSHSSFSGYDSERSSISKKKKKKKETKTELIRPRHNKHNQFFDADTNDDQFNCAPSQRMYNKINAKKNLIKYLLYLNDKRYFKLKKRILKKLGYILQEKKRKIKRENSMDWLMRKRGGSRESKESKEEKQRLTEAEKRFLNSEEADKIVF